MQGLGAAILMPQTLAILTMVFPPERRGAAFGVWGAVAGVATIAGPTLGGLLVTAFDWRYIFFVNLPIGVIVIVLAGVLIPDLRTGRRHRLDLAGVLLASVALLAICYGLVEGQRYNWSTITSFVSIPLVLAVGVVLLAVFLLVQRAKQADEPLIPFSLFRSRNFSLMNWVSGTVTIGMMGIFLPFTIYLQSVLGFSALKAGLSMAPASVISMFIAPVAGRLSDRIGGKFILMTGLSCFAFGMGWIALTAQPNSAWYHFLPGLIVAGFGYGLHVRPDDDHRNARRPVSDGRCGLRCAEHHPSGRRGDRHRGRRRAASEQAGRLADQPGQDAHHEPSAERQGPSHRRVQRHGP